MQLIALPELDENAPDAIHAARQNLLLLSVMAVVGVLLAVAVGAVAANWIHRALQDADRAATALRLHTDVDSLHDALRADVQAVALGLDARSDYDAHARQLEAALQRLEGLPLPAQIDGALREQRPQLRSYVEYGRRLLRRAGALTHQELAAFTAQWRALEDPLAATSDRMRQLVTEAEASGSRAYTNGLILLALSLVLIGSAVLHTSKRIAQAVLSTSRQLAAATQEAQRASRSRSEFLAAMSHEIRTPMTGVLGLVDLLAAEDLDARQRRYVDSLGASGRHLLAVINDILDFTRIESGRLDLEQIDFSLPDVLERLRSLVHPLAVDRGIALHIRLAPHSPPVLRGDPTRIQQVLLNLLANAIKFTDSGSVSLDVAPADGDAPPRSYRFAVRDTGIGIAPERLAGLFDAFRQADESIARRFGGSGLGLAICKRLVEAMGGSIGAQSTPGAGSLFFFELPLALGDPERLVTRASAQQRRGPPRRILVAEDVEVNREILGASLRQAGHALTFAHDGAQAVELAHGERYDLILMDVQMPVMDGLEATRRIRAGDGPNRAIPIVALTANVMAQERERYLAAGMDGCLGKPIDWDELFAAIARHGGDAPAPAAPAPADPPSEETPLLQDEVLADMEAMAGREQVRDWQRLAFEGYRRAAHALAQPGADPRAEAHKLRGSAGTLGLARLRALAERIELASPDDPDLPELLAQIDSTLEATRRELQRRQLL